MLPILAAVDDVRPDLVRLRTTMVNVYFLRTAQGWVLIDTGLKGSAHQILEVAERRFGNQPPQAILMTHAHFDHVGGLPALLRRWDVPVLAHAREVPHINGDAAYPPPDPTVGKGALAAISFLYPHTGADLGDRARPLPDDGSIPGVPNWRWIATPGHSEGHVSFFCDESRVLLAGDAFVTTQQESFLSVATQARGIHGPPAYFTPDWPTAKASVEALAALAPAVAATGHGTPMHGEALTSGLHDLVSRFDEVAVPKRGRYV